MAPTYKLDTKYLVNCNFFSQKSVDISVSEKPLYTIEINYWKKTAVTRLSKFIGIFLMTLFYNFMHNFATCHLNISKAAKNINLQ